MSTPLGRWSGLCRWPIVAAVAVMLAALAQFNWVEAERPPQLGLRVTPDGIAPVVDWVQPGGAAWDGGVRPGDRVVVWDSRAAGPGDDPAAIAAAGLVEARASSGALHTASARSGADSLLVTIRRRLAFLFLAGCFATVGGVVFVLATDMIAASLLLACTAAAAATLIGALGTRAGGMLSLAGEYLALITFGATTFVLFLTFPINYLSLRRGRGLAIICGVLHVALALWYGLAVGGASATYAILQPVTYAALIADLVGALVLVASALIIASPARREVRRAMVLVMLGLAVGILPFSLLVLAPRIIGLDALFPEDLAILSIAALPTSLGSAVLSRQFFGVTRVARRGLVVLTVWIALFAAYSLTLTILLQRIAPWVGPAALASGSALISVAVVAGTFPLVQRHLRRALERLLFRDIYDLAPTLEWLGAEIARLRSVDAIVTHVLTRLGAILDLRWAAIELAVEQPRVRRWSAGQDTVRSERTPSLVTADAEMLAVQLIADGAPIGGLLLGPKQRDGELLREDAALVTTLAPLVAAALQGALLVQRLEGQVVALAERERELGSLSARLIEVQEEERQRIALDLHDDPLQRAILLARRMGEAGCDGVPTWRQDVDEIIGSLRAICVGLRPPVLDDLGLAAGLEQLVNRLRARDEVTITLALQPAGWQAVRRLPPAHEIALFRVAQEALNNCLRHAHATQIAVTLHHECCATRLVVADDGVGLATVCPGATGTPPHLGIVGMRERLRPLGGTVLVEPGVNGGTIVTAELPLGNCADAGATR
jgi:signal transduction histidine kinase